MIVTLWAWVGRGFSAIIDFQIFWVDTPATTECPPELKWIVDLSVPSRTALASRAVAAQSERPDSLGSHAASLALR
jgi:hypothetical protein